MNDWKMKLLGLISKNWWKFILIILAAGIAFSGWAFQIGPLACDKQALKVKTSDGKEISAPDVIPAKK